MTAAEQCEPNPGQIQPNQTAATGVLPPPSAHSQGRDHFQLAILQGSSTEEDEGDGNKIVSQASLKNKPEGVGPFAGLTFAALTVWTIGILKM